MNPLLELNHVSYTYHSKSGETCALSDISFWVYPSEFIAIVGPSGCGKSTMLSLISGLLPAESGSILFHGKTDKSKIGYMLQRDHLFEWRTIYRNITLGLEIQHRLNEESRLRVEKMLKDYGLERFRNARPGELSGGMRQRAALIRTLAPDPELLLLDEPFSALDYQTRLSVCDDVSAILRKEKKTALLVTHDLSEAISMADRILVLTRRPARLRAILDVKFAAEEQLTAEPAGLSSREANADNTSAPKIKKRLTPLERRNAPEFQGYFNLLWKELNADEDR
ncbi:MAG: ABC transporter ATP-binding protein [Lachnospiraceae bacterium]|nr:ABC transporter ATP-binding protein [Lachnospiraceae bacterium]